MPLTAAFPAFLANGGIGRSHEDVVARLVLLAAAGLVLALVLTFALWLRQAIRSRRGRGVESPARRHDRRVARAGSSERGDRPSAGAHARGRWALTRQRLRELPPAARAYALFMCVTAPGVPLTLLGALSHDGTLLVTGLVSAALWVIDSAVVLPFVLARASSRGQDDQPLGAPDGD